MACNILFSLSHAYSCIALTNGKQVLQFQLELYSYKCMSVCICVCKYVVNQASVEQMRNV